MLGICHNATPFFLFSNLPLAQWQPSISCCAMATEPSGSARQAQCEYARALRALLDNSAHLPPHLDKGKGPRTSTVHTHTHTFDWPLIITKKTTIRHKMSWGFFTTETHTTPSHTHWCFISFICLMFSMVRKLSHAKTIAYGIVLLTKKDITK